jgi:hypothetical protein
MLDGPSISEMGVAWPNAFRIGCFWVLKPTFPRISAGKRRKLAMGVVSSFSLLGGRIQF